MGVESQYPTLCIFPGCGVISYRTDEERPEARHLLKSLLLELTIVDTDRIIAELEAERSRLETAIAALQGRNGRKAGRGRGRLSAAARRRISEGMKRRWAARKKASKVA